MKITYFIDGELLEREATEEEISPLNEEEEQRIAALKVSHAEAVRRKVFQDEADPIFFKAQRGEATMEEWEAKVAEIKARFEQNPTPTPDEL